MTDFEDELNRQLQAAVEHVYAPSRLVIDARDGGRRRLRRRRALQIAPLATVLTGLAALTPHLSPGDRNQSAGTPATASAPVGGAPLPATTRASTPAPDGALSDADLQAREAFFDAGYTYDDAVQLGALWNQNTDEAKVSGGQRLLSEQPLPIDPSS